MYLGRHELDLEGKAATREWLLTNGLGGFSSSTVGGRNTRRYHGWLVAQVARYGGRFVVLADVEEEVSLDGVRHDLDYRHLQGFALAPLPVFVYYLGGFFIERTMFMTHGANRTTAVYEFHSPRDTALGLALRPLVTFRFYHHLLRANDWPFAIESGPGWVVVQAHEGSPYLVLRFAAEGRTAQAHWTAARVWRQGVDYSEERRRGLDAVEDLFVPGRVEFQGLEAGDRVAVAAVLAESESEMVRLRDEAWGLPAALEARAAEERRLRALERQARETLQRIASATSASDRTARHGLYLHPGERSESAPAEAAEAPLPEIGDPRTPEARAFLGRLVRATDAFVAVRGGPSRDGVASDTGRRTTVIAGYPWFEDWGRDTLIAFPGLFLVTGRFREGFEVLRDYASFVRDGLVPNRFPDQAPEPDYNTADASLWLFWAVQYYLAYAGAARGLSEAEVHDEVRSAFLGPLREIAARYLAGTRFGIGTGADGLVFAGEPGFALTWMDAKLGDWVVTPRRGCPVEINALWYNALRFLAELDGSNGWAALAARVKESFNARFWNPDAGCLYDVVPPAAGGPSAGGGPPAGGSAPDASIRPNQVLAVSLPYPVLDPRRWRAVVDVCLRDLYATYGLRTLSPADPGYRGFYRGNPAERDSAYHQGTSWPWLLGPFITALRRAHGRSEASRLIAARMIRPFERHLREAGIGYISEVFDGDYPFWPGGCIAQAWSVAEILRAYVEEVLDLRPPGLEPEPEPAWTA